MRHIALIVIIFVIASPARADQPLLAHLDRFTASNVPTSGPAELSTTRRSLDLPTTKPTWPGKGLAQHPMLIGGEGFNQLHLVRDGKIVWTYGVGRGGEIDDAWMLSNGNILFTRQSAILEVTPDKKVAWQFDCPPGTECHSSQPIGLDKVLVMLNGLPPKLMLINKKSGVVEMQHVLPAPSETDPKTVHAQVRHARMTKEGTYLVPFLSMNKVVEYDTDWKEIFSYDAKSPWAAIRLENGNILISGNAAGWVREVNRKGETVWELSREELPGITLRTVQEVSRLANGNTLICTCGTGGSKTTQPNLVTSVQLVEVTPDKKVVWVVQDWEKLGPVSWAQLLDEPGVPENRELRR